MSYTPPAQIYSSNDSYCEGVGMSKTVKKNLRSVDKPLPAQEAKAGIIFNTNRYKNGNQAAGNYSKLRPP